MYRVMACVGMMLCGGPLAAAGLGLDHKASEPELNATLAHNFAQQLLVYVIDPITQQYVRPVSKAELVAAALTGLYEAAQKPVPPGLLGSVHKAASDQELLNLLAQSRSRLGDVEALRGPNAVLVSIRALAQVLDPYSGLIPGSELARHNSVSDTSYGVGLEIEANSGVGPLLVKAVVPGSPAQRAGLRPGDRITHLDGKLIDGPAALAGLRVGGASPLFDTAEEPGEQPVKALRVTVQGPGAKAGRQVALEPGRFRPETVFGVVRNPDNSWSYWADKSRRIASIRLGSLSMGTDGELAEALRRLRADEARGLLLDLRWCPGGYLQKSALVAQMFLRAGLIARVEYRDKDRNEQYAARGGAPLLEVPMVVLVNEESSGGAELIAAALQDNHRALVAGQRTRGKASIQIPLPLPIANAGMKVTGGLFIRPNGKNLNRFPDSRRADDWGVRPDAELEFRVSPDLGKQLRDWWLLQTLRPGSSNEALPLDDPAADPQREAALQALARLVK
jgi:C-terminal peptidase prc